MQCSKSLVFLVTFVLSASCGGRVETGDGGSGGGGGAGSGGRGGSSGVHTGGAPQKCSSALDCKVPVDCTQCADGTVVCPEISCSAGNCVTATPDCPAGIPGTCNPAFCTGTSAGAGCCLSVNGPCGVDFGNGCVDRSACPYGGCATPAGESRD